LESVRPQPGEFERMREVAIDTNLAMARKGMFSMDMMQKMQSYIDDYRREQNEISSGTQ